MPQRPLEPEELYAAPNRLAPHYSRFRVAERIALGQNTHELVVRFLSALPLRRRPRLVTTDGEFHTIRRQLDETIDLLGEVARGLRPPPPEQ